MRQLLFALLLGFAVGCSDEPATPGGPGGEQAPLSQGGPLHVYFTTPERSPESGDNPARTLAGYIDQCRSSVDVCAFELDNQVITDALVRAVRRGLRVRLVTETNYLNEAGVQALKAVGVPVVDDKRDGALMHDKFMVLDGKAVWTGSMNFTENCAYRNNNHGLHLDDARVAEDYATKFRWMFEQHKFGGLPSRSDRIPNPQVSLSDGTPVEVYFSTHDHIADKLVQKIGQARKSVHFLAFSFTHDRIGQAMLERARQGVEVKGVFEKSQAAGGYSEYGNLKAAGLDVWLDANPRNMHHKVLIVDDETVVAGSFNFSDGADRQNDENVVILHSKPAARQFEEEFQKLHAAARTHAAPLTLLRSRH
jgi:phosphatidylserine/phosphatidylglycerophosphate/cardiolipin synthase-like enzyme